MVTCSYCRGTENGQTISVLGTLTEQDVPEKVTVSKDD